ncbi:unnamed protein product [Psylliodes chrysocephalus]|uniref:Uncharacterized protein n=1 Tax=Psylliodes chrysocephalus TaxID=3402493 RepID=A0A9P0GEX2_9CUCU|nr:unnamed protein product [Psylliodes chrysocephala]
MKRQWSELKAEKQIAYEKRVEKRALKNKYMIEKFYEVKDRPRRFPISAKAACKIATNEDLISMGIRKANVKPKAPAEPAGKTLIRKSIELVRHKPLILTSKVEVVANKFEAPKRMKEKWDEEAAWFSRHKSDQTTESQDALSLQSIEQVTIVNAEELKGIEWITPVMKEVMGIEPVDDQDSKLVRDMNCSTMIDSSPQEQQYVNKAITAPIDELGDSLDSCADILSLPLEERKSLAMEALRAVNLNDKCILQGICDTFNITIAVRHSPDAHIHRCSMCKQWFQHSHTYYQEHADNINLKQALNNGLKLVKIHKVLQFKQSAWLKPYIDLNTRLRTAARSDLKLKLMNNAGFVFGYMHIKWSIEQKIMDMENNRSVTPELQVDCVDKIGFKVPTLQSLAANYIYWTIRDARGITGKYKMIRQLIDSEIWYSKVGITCYFILPALLKDELSISCMRELV